MFWNRVQHLLLKYLLALDSCQDLNSLPVSLFLGVAQ